MVVGVVRGGGGGVVGGGVQILIGIGEWIWGWLKMDWEEKKGKKYLSLSASYFLFRAKRHSRHPGIILSNPHVFQT